MYRAADIQATIVIRPEKKKMGISIQQDGVYYSSKNIGQYEHDRCDEFIAGRARSSKRTYTKPPSKSSAIMMKLPISTRLLI
jgi:hypothetical protein